MRIEGVTGCTDGNCIWGHPGGMHTNGGCNCEKDMQRALGIKEFRKVKLNILALRRAHDKLRQASYAVANAIHAGAGGFIQDTLMEAEFRKALGLKKGELVGVPK